MEQIYVDIPTEDVFEEIEIINKFNKQKIILLNQNQTLKEARDMLLPRLMNGRVGV